MHWLSIILRIMKAHMNSQNNETSRHTPTLVISVIFADNRWKFCFLKEIVFHLLRRCCQSGSIFYYLDPHLGPAWVHPLRHPGAVSSSAASPATGHGKSRQLGKAFEVQLSVVPAPSYTLLPFWQQIITPTQLHIKEFNVAVIRSWSHCELMVVSRHGMFAFVNWDWIMHTEPCPWLLANFSKSSPCSE